ncbi:hypothetical protein NQZ68_041562 [Dissostichus eleginoides]|nr:hypothetical protein NQZ68_041562 [Dissostichus eleginoides]
MNGPEEGQIQIYQNGRRQVELKIEMSDGGGPEGKEQDWRGLWGGGTGFTQQGAKVHRLSTAGGEGNSRTDNKKEMQQKQKETQNKSKIETEEGSFTSEERPKRSH